MRRNQKIALALAILLAFGLVWSRLRIYVWLHASLWAVLVALFCLVLAFYLGLSAVTERPSQEPPPDADDS
jgi:uncharacterized membrane protein